MPHDERGKAIYEMVNTVGWKEFFMPYLNQQIAEWSSINKIDEKDVERTYMKARMKKEAFMSIKNTIENWM